MQPSHLIKLQNNQEVLFFMCLIVLWLRGDEKVVQDEHFQLFAVAEAPKMADIRNFLSFDTILKKKVKKSSISKTVIKCRPDYTVRTCRLEQLAGCGMTHSLLR